MKTMKLILMSCLVIPGTFLSMKRSGAAVFDLPVVATVAEYDREKVLAAIEEINRIAAEFRGFKKASSVKGFFSLTKPVFDQGKSLAAAPVVRPETVRFIDLRDARMSRLGSFEKYFKELNYVILNHIDRLAFEGLLPSCLEALDSTVLFIQEVQASFSDQLFCEGLCISISSTAGQLKAKIRDRQAAA